MIKKSLIKCSIH